MRRAGIKAMKQANCLHQFGAERARPLSTVLRGGYFGDKKTVARML